MKNKRGVIENARTDNFNTNKSNFAGKQHAGEKPPFISSKKMHSSRKYSINDEGK